MTKKIKTVVFSLLIFLACSIYAIAAPVPDTGQTTSYTDTFGEDSDYLINPPSYTKLDADGNDLPDTATSWTMVRDNVTGLIWEVKTDDGSVHDKDNTYTWYDSNPDTNGGDAGTPGNGTDTEDFINALNSSNYGGHSDWRLPTMEELLSIIDYGIYNPAINGSYFPNRMSSRYWSSTTLVDSSNRARYVNFIYGYGSAYGIDNYSDKSYSHYIRAVRGGQTGSFDNLVGNGDGTVTDTATGLMWQQDTEGLMNWEASLGYCENLSLAGFSDWRLPTAKELASILDLSKRNPAIDTDYFPNTVSFPYWSSTTRANTYVGAWIVGFGDGGVYDLKKSDSYYVRAVRAGQSGSIDLDNGLVAHYPFNGNANDASGNGNDGVVFGATLSEDRFGNANSAYSFDGTNQLIRIEPSSSLESFKEITLSAWFKTRSCDAEVNGIVTRWNQDHTFGDYYGLFYDCRNDSTYVIGSSHEYYNQQTNPPIKSEVQINSWTHVTYSISPMLGKERLYINGQLIVEKSRTESIRNCDLPIIIGADIKTYQMDDYSRFYDGVIDDVRIYNRALSEPEIKALFSESDTSTTTTTTTTTTTIPPTTTTTLPPTTTTTIPSDPYSEQHYSSLQIYLAEGSPEKEYYDVDEIINLYVNYKNSDGTNINLDDMAAFGVAVDWITNNPIIATVLDGQVEFKDNGKVKVIASSGGMTSNYDFMVGEAGGATKDYGNLIILAGGDQNDSKDKIKNAIQYLANRMYSIFKARGFTDEDIYYINHIDTQDLDGDGVADGIVDQTEKTVETFQNAIKWAEAQANDGPLYLYVVNHGEKNATFLIDSGQILTGSQFDAFLDNFEDNTNRVSIVMLEACYSGSFIDPLADTDRVVFSSSAADKYSFLSDAGDVSFSQFLSTYLLSGYDWEESFDLAANDLTVIGAPYAGMNPQKAIGSQVVPGKVFGDFSMASFLPKVETYTPGETVGANMEQTFSVELDMLDIGGVTVWATVTPPNYQPPTVTGEYSTPALGLDSFTLANVESSKTFIGSYTFPCNGTYQVTYYVKDSSGNVISIAPQAFVAAGGGECDFITSISTAWNLISLPVIPDDPSVAAIFADMKENVTSAWKWHNGKWAVYLPGDEDGGAAYASSKGFGQLTEIGCGEGFWVNSSINQNLSVSGSQPADTSCSLTEGWNLIGLKSDEAKSIADFVSGNEPKIASVWKWESGSWAVYLPGEDDGGAAYAQSKGFTLLEKINPGEGFWVNVDN
jgi:hypothetical protein